jgi:zinc protease
VRGTVPAIALAAAALAACGRGDPPPEPGWTRLPNGLRYCVKPVEGAKDVAVLTVFEIGSDHDPVGESGLAHLTEHLWVTSAAGETKARTVDEWAAQCATKPGAFTMPRWTVFFSAVVPDRLDAELADVAARMSDLRIEQSDLDRERPRVLQQIDEAQSVPPIALALRTAADRVAPLPNGGDAFGVAQDLAKLDVSDFRDRARRYYQPINARLVIAGAVDAGAARALVEKRFAGMPRGERAPEPEEPGAEQPGRVEVESKAPMTTGAERKRVVCIACTKPAEDASDWPAYELLELRAGLPLFDMKAPSSPEFTVATDDDRRVSRFVWLGDDRPVESIVPRLDDEITRCCEHGATAEEMAALRSAAGFQESSDETRADADEPRSSSTEAAIRAVRRLERDRFLGRIGELHSVTPSDLRRVADKWLAPDRRVVVVAWGPVTPEPPPPPPTTAKRSRASASYESRLAAISETVVTLRWDEDAQTVRRSIGDREYPDDGEFEKAVAAAHEAWTQKGKPDAPVTIDADSRVSWSDVMRTVNAVKRCGIEKIEFMMGAPPKTGAPK